MMKKIFLSLLLFISVGLSGCFLTNKASQMEKINSKQMANITSPFTTTYEVFLYSFNDSDGDGIGDINGLIEKLPYIKDLGFTSLWMMPIHPSPTYHKYDVKDYYDIDPQYGTLDDFKDLITKCNENNMKVIIDLVLNHTSVEHPWFQEAKSYLESLEDWQTPSAEECKYIDYYHFSKEFQTGYAQLGNSSYFYEARFWEGMPDLNLDNQLVKDEIRSIMEYWLDLGVSGFRLDAVTSYYTGNIEGNVSFLRWLNETGKEINEDCYFVGEAWTNQNEIAKLYESGIDSLFDFPFGNVDGIIHETTLKNIGVDAYVKKQMEAEEYYSSKNPNYINAPFYTNHDMARSAGYYAGDSEAKVKLSGALNLLMSGNVFVYYGEEIGMKGAGKDENKRAPMQWSSEENCLGPKDMDDFDMKYPPLNEQEKNAYSIYNYYKQAIHLRNAFPSITCGKTNIIDELSDQDYVVYQKTYEDETVYIIISLKDETNTIDLSSLEINELSGVLQTTEEKIELDNKILIIPSYGIAIFKK